MPYHLDQMKTLVIDDNKPICFLLKSLLNDLGVKDVITAHSGQTGWTAYLQTQPDLIFADWRMKEMDGLTFTRKVRRDLLSYQPHTPIIMMTSYKTKEKVMKARDSGINEFIAKPFTVERLAKTITRVIEKPRDFIVSRDYMGPDHHPRK